MAARVAITRQARQDIAEAYDWYENDQPGRGTRFLARVRECVTAISRVPLGGKVYHRDYRRAVVQRFPYIVVDKYDAGANLVTVHAVFHTSRDPNDLINRLP